MGRNDAPPAQYPSTMEMVGLLWGIRPPLLFDGQRLTAMQPPPALGEHSAEILLELEQEKPERR